MLKIAICDDEERICQYLQDVILRLLHVRADCYTSGEALLESGEDYDIFLIDICFSRNGGAGQMDGMETARKIRMHSNAILIFITAIRDYVYEAYDVEAFHYLLKPIQEDKLCDVLKKAAAKVGQKQAAFPLLIKVNGKSIQVPVGDIFYGESDGRKIILHTKNGIYTYYEKMELLEQKLGEGFFRSHRGYLVNLQEVSKYDRMSITLKCGDTVFLAKKKYNDFVAAYMDVLTK